MPEIVGESAVVLFSGGQDSTTCLYWARERFKHVHALTINYGQRHSAELSAADEITHLTGVDSHQHLSMDFLRELGDSDLVKPVDLETEDIKPNGGYADREMPEGLPTSFVPGRNAFFITAAAAYAAKVGAQHVVTGVCQTDYSGYPDCRSIFVKSMELMLNLGFPSSCPTTIHTPLMWLTKSATVKMARKLPGCWDALALSVTCYENYRAGCGQCPSCLLRAQGFADAGYEDPALTAVPTPYMQSYVDPNMPLED